MDKRSITQVCAVLITNANFKGFFQGKIFRGEIKKICVPGLNCYSCPGAVGACPIGAMQAVIGTVKYNFSFYAAGLMALMGVILGRFICGWLCPFGFIQDLLYKIPTRKMKVKKQINAVLKYLKYIIFLVFVILFPMLLVNEFGLGAPYFCEYICPTGTLEGGIPLVIMEKSLRNALGLMFAWKLLILVIIMLLAVFVYRPFCRYICPLGAFYSLFNKISIYRYRIDKDKCTSCLSCTSKCKVGIEVYKDPNSLECIRCGECIKACHQKAIKSTFSDPAVYQTFS